MNEQYLIDKHCALIDALRKVDSNKQGFVIVTESDNTLFGILTDGDIRRFLVAGGGLRNDIESAVNRECLAISNSKDIGDAIELLKNGRIKFLPVVDDDNRICNVIIKRKLQAALLLDLSLTLMYDFDSIDENIIDYEIFPRPWGFYKSTFLNSHYQGKIISVKPKQRLSLQSHCHREEHWTVLYGEGTVELADTVITVYQGSTVFIPKGCKHRLTNTCSTENLIVSEVQIGDYLGEDDIIRYEDDYDR